MWGLALVCIGRVFLVEDRILLAVVTEVAVTVKDAIIPPNDY